MGARTRNYKNTKTRFDLTPFQLVPYTTAKEREEYYHIDREGEYLPGTLRYNWVGSPNNCQDM